MAYKMKMRASFIEMFINLVYSCIYMTEREKIKKKELGILDLFEKYLEDYRADEILEREVVKFGNSSHVLIPSKHLGKVAKIIIKPKEEGDKKES